MIKMMLAASVYYVTGMSNVAFWCRPKEMAAYVQMAGGQLHGQVYVTNGWSGPMEPLSETFFGTNRNELSVPIEFVVGHTNGPEVLDYLTGRKVRLEGTVETTVKTNVVEGDNHRGCVGFGLVPRQSAPGIIYADAGPYHPWHEDCAPFVPATEKWTITTIEKTYTLKFDWRGPWELRTYETLSCTTNLWKLESAWKQLH